MENTYRSPELYVLELDYTGAVLADSITQPGMEDFDVSEGAWN